MIKAKIKLTKYPVNKLVTMLSPDNPRNIPQSKDNPLFKELEDSMQRFGYVVPIIVNKRTNHIVSGHFRVLVLKENNVKEVDVIEVDLPKTKEQALNITLNSIKGDWDIEKLQNIINVLVVKNIDLTGTGFNTSEINIILNSKEEKDKLKTLLNDGTKPNAKISWACRIGQCNFKIDDSIYHEFCKLMEKQVDVNKIIELGCND
jgi:hypothetical protein